MREQNRPGSEIQHGVGVRQRRSARGCDESNPIGPKRDGWQENFRNIDWTARVLGPVHLDLLQAGSPNSRVEAPRFRWCYEIKETAPRLDYFPPLNRVLTPFGLT